MNYISLEQLLALHVIAVSQGGGSTGLRDVTRIQSCVGAQRQTVFGNALYPTVYEKSAIFIRNIICDHPFVDGNKRTALLAGLTLLRINNIRFVAQKGEIEDFAVFVATKKPSIQEIASWLKAHSK